MPSTSILLGQGPVLPEDRLCGDLDEHRCIARIEPRGVDDKRHLRHGPGRLSSRRRDGRDRQSLGGAGGWQRERDGRSEQTNPQHLGDPRTRDGEQSRNTELPTSVRWAPRWLTPEAAA